MQITDKSASHPHGMWRVLVSAAVIGLAVAACSVQSRDRLKHFFFEVPKTNAESGTEAPAKAAAAGTETAAGTASAAPTPAAHTAFGGTWPKNVVSRHPPFAERRCSMCHDAHKGNAPLADQMPGCKSCHSELFQYRRYEHGPFASRDCLHCHEMHTSRWEKLLHKPETKLCVDCHAAQYSDEALTTYHASINSQKCTDCHDPHFSDNPRLLKPGHEGARAAAGKEAGR